MGFNAGRMCKSLITREKMLAARESQVSSRVREFEVEPSPEKVLREEVLKAVDNDSLRLVCLMV